MKKMILVSLLCSTVNAQVLYRNIAADQNIVTAAIPFAVVSSLTNTSGVITQAVWKLNGITDTKEYSHSITSRAAILMGQKGEVNMARYTVSDLSIASDTNHTFFLPNYGGTFAMYEDLSLVTMRAKVGEAGGIEKARAVYVSSGVGGNVIVKKSSNNVYSSLPVIGVSMQSGAYNEFIDVALFGPLRGFDTSHITEGNDAYLGTNGMLSSSVDGPTNALIVIGKCTKSSGSAGQVNIFIRPYFQDGAYDGSMRYTVKNASSTSLSTANFYALNDLDKIAQLGIHGSGHFKGPAVIMRGSYGRIVFGNSTRNPFVWHIDMTNSGLDFPLWDWPLMALVPHISGVYSNAYLGVGTTNPVEMLDVTMNGLIRSNLTVNGTLYNRTSKFIPPRWVDEKFAGLGISPGVTAPQLIDVTSGSEIKGLGFDQTDYGYFTLQWQHGTTSTNSMFPNLYYIPHIHISLPTAPVGAESNVTFVIHYRITPIKSSFSGSDIYRTNTLGIAGASLHNTLSFGDVTNNLLQDSDSVVVHGLIRRIVSPDNDFGSTRVILDSLDFHIPVDSYGSLESSGDLPDGH